MQAQCALALHIVEPGVVNVVYWQWEELDSFALLDVRKSMIDPKGFPTTTLLPNYKTENNMEIFNILPFSRI